MGVYSCCRQANKLIPARERLRSLVVTTSPTFRAGRPRLLFEGNYADFYDVFPDGLHFVAIKPNQEQPATRINVVLNWFEELKQRVPTNN